MLGLGEGQGDMLGERPGEEAAERGERLPDWQAAGLARRQRGLQNAP